MNSNHFELLDTSPRVSVRDEEYSRLLGYPRGHQLRGRARQLADEAREWYAARGRPWILARKIDAVDVGARNVRLEGVGFTSKRLVELLAGAHARGAVVIAVSAGAECEDKARELWREEKPDEYFFMEVFGSAVVEHLIAVASGHICTWADAGRMSALPHYSPGYSEWDVAEQARLRQLIRRSDGFPLPGDLHVMDSGMLRPKKSLLAVVGLTSVENASRLTRSEPCETCSLFRCQYRRMPYTRVRPQIEDVRWLQKPAPERPETVRPGVSALTRDATYSLSPRALRKWSQDVAAQHTKHRGIGGRFPI